MVGDVTLCTSFLQAYNTLGLEAPEVRAVDLPGPEHPQFGDPRQGARRLVHHDLGGPSKADNAEYAFLMKKFAPKANPNPNVSSNQADGVTPVLALGPS